MKRVMTEKKTVIHIVCNEADRRWLEECVRRASEGTYIDFEQSENSWRAELRQMLKQQRGMK